MSSFQKEDLPKQKIVQISPPLGTREIHVQFGTYCTLRISSCPYIWNIM